MTFGRTALVRPIKWCVSAKFRFQNECQSTKIDKLRQAQKSSRQPKLPCLSALPSIAPFFQEWT